MTTKEYIEKFKNNFSLIHVYVNKSNYKIYHFKHKTLNKDIILRLYTNKIAAYDELVKIKHENLPLVYDSILLDDGQIILEEFINGITIAQVLETGKYNLRGAKIVLKSVCNALSVLHSLNIVHRDIKPENIILTNDGKIVLIDFNTARKISEASKDTVILGTIGYASPEQLGIAQSDTRTDIYALGVLLNVMVTSKHPSEKLAKGKVGRIVKKCTNVNPDERYQSTEKLIKAL